jgi:hypothetical protein
LEGDVGVECTLVVRNHYQGWGSWVSSACCNFLFWEDRKRLYRIHCLFVPVPLFQNRMLISRRGWTCKIVLKGTRLDITASLQISRSRKSENTREWKWLESRVCLSEQDISPSRSRIQGRGGRILDKNVSPSLIRTPPIHHALNPPSRNTSRRDRGERKERREEPVSTPHELYITHPTLEHTFTQQSKFHRISSSGTQGSREHDRRPTATEHHCTWLTR